MQLVYFIVMVGILVFVHELGHFAWAKVFGVQVLRVSLGFGPRIAGFRRGETEYVVSALPLGGYVRMLGENPLDEIRPQDTDRSFAHQSLLRRIVIVVAGPAMNLVFPVLLYFIVFLGDTDQTPASVGIVLPDRPADGLLEPGDRIVAVDGEEIATFYEMSEVVGRNPDRSLKFVVEREGERFETAITPVRAVEDHPLDVSRHVGRIGVMPQHPLAVIGVTSPGSPAAKAGLRTFDVVVAASGKPVERFIDLERVLRHNRGTMVPLTYLRPQRITRALGGLADLEVLEPRVAALTPAPGGGSGLTRAGIELADLYVSDVAKGSPEHRIGLLPGDRLLELDGEPVRLWSTFFERLGKSSSHTLRYRRGDEVFTRTYTLAHERGVTEHGQLIDRNIVGIRNWMPTHVDASVPNPRPVTYAVREAWRATAEVVELTLVSMVRLFQGRLTVKSLGGPLTIFEVADSAAREGPLNYLTLMAFISINLGLINLLPIPLLDGGHMAFFLIEAVMRRPLSLRAREIAHTAGFILLVAVMVLAFMNDLERQWPRIIEQIGSR
ncbi:MAG: RIP metalloprotease RseP [Myxococcales bacterium]|nr:RIP metalloprotease RseP [Myxococcales bacterium]